MANPRVSHCMFCDDIRFEVGNKLSLMGLYSGDLVINHPFPAVLPKLAIVIWLICDADDTLEKLITTVTLPDGTDIVRIEATDLSPPIIQDDIKKAIYTQSFPIVPFPVSAGGAVEVWLETEREKTRAGRLLLHSMPPELDQINPSPTASPPPS